MSISYGSEQPDAEQWADQGGAVHGAEGVRKVVLVSPRDVKMRPVRWLWDHRIPLGELTIAAGRAGIGKSQAMVWAAAQVSRGMLEGHHYGRPGHVLYIATEDSLEHTVVPRLHAAGADLDRVHLVQVLNAVGRETSLSLSLDLLDIRQAMVDTGATLVVLDALVSGMAGADLNKAADVRQLLEPLSHLAHDTGAGVVGLAHFRKSGGGDPLAALAGSSAFGEVVRSALGFAADLEGDEPSFVLSTIKSNLAPATVPSLQYRIDTAVVDTPEGLAEVGKFVVVGESDTHVRDLLGEQAGPRDGEDGDDIRGWLHSYLARNGGVAEPEDIVKAGRAAGYSPDQLKRAKKPKGRYPKVHSRKAGMDGGWVWSLEEGTDDEEGTEGSRKGAKSAVQTEPLPSHSSVLPSGNSPGQCRTCSTPAKPWVLDERDGQCITCSRTEGNPAA